MLILGLLLMYLHIIYKSESRKSTDNGFTAFVNRAVVMTSDPTRPVGFNEVPS